MSGATTVKGVDLSRFVDHMNENNIPIAKGTARQIFVNSLNFHDASKYYFASLNHDRIMAESSTTKYLGIKKYQLFLTVYVNFL